MTSPAEDAVAGVEDMVGPPFVVGAATGLGLLDLDLDLNLGRAPRSSDA